MNISIFGLILASSALNTAVTAPVSTSPEPAVEISVMAPVAMPAAALPVPPSEPVVEVNNSMSGRFYAYTSTVGQTDASPFTTASGQRVSDGIVANNCLPFGTKIRIPALFGDKVFVVQDRMNARYGCNSFDVWFANYGDAIQFGKRSATIEVLK